MFSAFKIVGLLFVPGEKCYFQRDNDLVNKKIQSIVYLPDVFPPAWSGIYLGAASVPDVVENPRSGHLVNIYLTTDGQRYDYVNNLTYLDPNMTNGIFPDINRILDFENCYLEAPDFSAEVFGGGPKITKPFLITLGVFYEDESMCTQSVIHNSSKHKSLSEIIIPKSSSTKNFPFFDDPNLKSVLLRNLTFTDVFYHAFDTEYNKIMMSCFITLCNGSRIIWRDMPVVLLAQILYITPLKFKDLRFTLSDSYITYDGSFNTSGVTKNIPLNFILEYVEER